MDPSSYPKLTPDKFCKAPQDHLLGSSFSKRVPVTAPQLTKHKLRCLNSFLQSFKFIEGIASQTETQAWIPSEQVENALIGLPWTGTILALRTPHLSICGRPIASFNQCKATCVRGGGGTGHLRPHRKRKISLNLEPTWEGKPIVRIA